MADVSRASIFDAAKLYLGGIHQQGIEIFDWDWTESEQELLYAVLSSAAYSQKMSVVATHRFSDSWPEEGATTTALTPDISAVTTTNNFTLNAGTFVQGGRTVYLPTSIEYDVSGTGGYASPSNWMFKGAVTGVTATTPAVDYTLLDANNIFPTGVGLAGCRVTFTSGLLDGNTYNIAARISDTSFQVLGDLTGIITADTYVIIPPALDLPASSDYYLMTWFTEVNEAVDPDLEDPTFLLTQSVRRQLRWCIYNSAPALTSSGSDLFDDVFISKIGSVYKTVGNTITVLGTDIFDIYTTTSDYGDFFQLTKTELSTRLDQLLQINAGTDVRVSIRKPYRSFFDAAAEILTYDDLELLSPFSKLLGKFSAVSIDNTDVAYQLENNVMLLCTDISATAPDLVAVATPIPVEQLVLETFRMEPATYRANRSMVLLGGHTIHGLCYNIHISSNLTITPGTIQTNGRLYQQPTELVIDVTDLSNWDTGALPGSDGWAYIYANVPLDGINRSIDSVTLSLVGPKWSGEYYSEIVGYLPICIGLFYCDTLGIGDGFRRGSRIFFGDVTIKSNVDGTAGAVGATIQPPRGALEINLLVKFVDTAAAVANSFVGAGWDVDLYASKYLNTVQETVSGESRTSVDLQLIGSNETPNTFTVYHTSSNGATALATFKLVSVVIDINFWPDSQNWTTT